MKISNESKNELRDQIIEQLKRVPEGQRIKLGKDILEDLLFDAVVLNKEEGIIVKLPVWSGDFLQKIDLSEVDFSDVSWTMLNDDDEDLEDRIRNDDGIVVTNDDAITTICRIKKANLSRWDLTGGFSATYEGTNAKIDLTKSFEAKHSNSIEIFNCNFSGLDFSEQDLTGIKYVLLNRADISGTNLSIPANIVLEAWVSWLRDIDLSTRKIDAVNYLAGEFADLGQCDLTNCGVQVILNPDKLKLDSQKRELKEAMSSDLVGCYVNGKKVLSDDEKQKLSQQKREEYEVMKNGIFAPITDDIEEQIGRMGK